jgi:hypothetical protein
MEMLDYEQARLPPVMAAVVEAQSEFLTQPARD